MKIKRYIIILHMICIFLIIVNTIETVNINKTLHRLENKQLITPTITTTPTILITPTPIVMLLLESPLILPETTEGLFKPYEDWKDINDKTSKQWALQRLCSTDKQGFRKFHEYYIVAMGSYYAKWIGQTFIVTLSSGKVFSIMIGDYKQDKHTDELNQYGLDCNDIIEFIVDSSVIPKGLGDMSKLGFEGAIIKIVEKK